MSNRCSQKVFNSRRALKLLLSGVAVTAMPTVNAMAQTEPVEDVIMVTARKQSTSLQDTPLAITALNKADIEAAGFEDIVDLSKAAPGLFVEGINERTARIDSSPRFRGVSFASQSPLQRTSSVFIDGIIVTGGIQSLGLKEVERVEVIKGPQSALFGRNTFSGAINYITADPKDEFAADLSLLAATRDEYRVNASVEGPVLGDILTGRLNGGYYFNGGHYDNAAVARQELGEESGWNMAATLLYQPDDKFKLRLRGNIYEDNDGPGAVVLAAGRASNNFGGFQIPDRSIGAAPGATFTGESVFRGTIPTPTAAQIGVNTSQEVFDDFVRLADLDPRAPVTFIDLDYDDLGGFGLVREGFRLSADATYEFSQNLSFDLLAGYNEDEYLMLQDFDGTSDFSFTNRLGQEIKDLSIEGRFSGKVMDDRLAWSIGANYINVKVEQIVGFRDEFANFYFGAIFSDRTFEEVETTGLFGSLDFKLTDKITLIAEGRYQEDVVSSELFQNDLSTGPSKGKFKNVLPRFLIQYEPNDTNMVYANYSVGNLPGGFNPEVKSLNAAQLTELEAISPGIGITFGEEQLKNYELGWKHSGFDGGFKMNIAGFYMQRSKQIFSGFEVISESAELTALNGNLLRTVLFNDNGASTDIYGLEFDSTVHASDNLTLQGTLGWINAKIASFPLDAGLEDFVDVYGIDANAKGQKAPRFPEWSGSLSISYEDDLKTNFFGKNSSWYARTDLYYTGETFDSNSNLAETASAVDVNSRLGIRRNNLSVELFVTNLFQEDAPTGAANFTDTSLLVRTQPGGLFDFSQEAVYFGLRPKRQFGIRLDYGF